MPARNEEIPLAVEIERTRERLRVLDGLVIALREPRVVLDLLLEAADVVEAREALRARLGLDELQASAVLDLQFRVATQLPRQKLEEDRRGVEAHLRYLRSLDEESTDDLTDVRYALPLPVSRPDLRRLGQEGRPRPSGPQTACATSARRSATSPPTAVTNRSVLSPGWTPSK